MKSKFVKSVVGLTCLLGVNAASAGDEVVIEDNAAATCEDGNCGKAKHSGPYVRLALGCSRDSGRLLFKGVESLGLSAHPDASFGGNKTTFVGDLAFGWSFVLTGESFLIAEAGFDFGGNSKNEFDQKISFYNDVAQANVNDVPYKGKVTRKGFAPWGALGFKWRHCPSGVSVALKGGWVWIKTEFDFQEEYFSNIHFSHSTVRPFVALNVEKKFGRVGGFFEVRHTFSGRKKEISTADCPGIAINAYELEGKQKETSFKLGATFSW